MLLKLYSTILINLLVEKYFHDRRCLIIFTDNSSDYNFDYNGILPTIKIFGPYPNFDIIFNYQGCQGSIINTEDPSVIIQQFETKIYNNLERFNRRRYLILSNFNENFKKIYQLPELYYIVDLLIIVPKALLIDLKTSSFSVIENKVIIFEFQTHKYIGVDNHNQSIILDYWFANNQSFQFNTDLFPNKLSNQHGRQLRMATFNYPPYTVLGDTTDESYGSEYSIGYFFSKNYNMTPVIVVNEDYWGNIYPNGTGYGLLGNLVEDRADVGFGALYTWEFCYHHLDLTKPSVRTGITCLVPEPKLASGWLTPLFSYTFDVWISIIAIFCLSVLTLTFSFQFYNNINNNNKNNKNNGNYVNLLILLGDSTILVFKQLLVQSLTDYEFPKERINKFILFLMLIFGLMITTIYSSGFTSIMTIPRYEAPINTAKDLAKSNLHWCATHEAWIMSIEQSNEPIDKKLVDKFIVGSEDELYELAKTYNYGFSIERLPYDNFAIGEYIPDDLLIYYRLMQEDLYWENCVLMTRKNSILLPDLDNFILRIYEVGLISKWQNEAAILFMNLKTQQIVKYYNHYHLSQNDNRLVKLKWIHVEGVFAILIIGHFISLIVFILELLVYKKTHDLSQRNTINH